MGENVNMHVQPQKTEVPLTLIIKIKKMAKNYSNVSLKGEPEQFIFMMTVSLCGSLGDNIKKIVMKTNKIDLSSKSIEEMKTLMRENSIMANVATKGNLKSVSQKVVEVIKVHRRGRIVQIKYNGLFSWVRLTDLNKCFGIRIFEIQPDKPAME